MSRVLSDASQSITKVALLAHIGKGNLGDEATMATAIENIRIRRPDTEIHAFTLNPIDTEARHNVPSHPLRRLRISTNPAATTQSAAHYGFSIWSLFERIKDIVKQIPLISTALRGLSNGMNVAGSSVLDFVFFVQSSRRLKDTDVVVIVGGGQLGDYFGGPWGFPYNLLGWSLLARIRRADVVYLSIGAGPINSPLSRFFLRSALSLANYRSFRDEGSLRLIESLGGTKKNHVFPDLVHGLSVSISNTRKTGDASVIGINPLPFHDARYWAEDNPFVYQRYIKKLALFAQSLIRDGYIVYLIPTQVIADSQVVHDIELLIRNEHPLTPVSSLICPPVQSLEDLLDVISRTDLVFASRFHGVVLSLVSSKPVIALAYNKKTSELMTDVGMGDYVSDIDQFDTEWMASRFERLLDESEAALSRVASRLGEYKVSLDDQYDRLFGPRPKYQDRA
ncbi:polysaccharide pyruvyl transferase family protein [Planctomyces sp. SH-PL62]|uniref:polysaccharide pyruvyl transferase family protein n=1 Tax=Planctomyces sp. SH-PL62 TaxID=1636152 RepID=UPI00078DB8E2|nr:polysaccharide pyruvyl transferase family protein [Planctomyces sp. SH-PL62]AMV39210.1 colanic acid biosynthesis protein [Planctomyces sp. SH-PL62]